MEPTANQVKYFIDYLLIEMVLGIIVYVILVIIAIIIIILLLKFLFQLFFIMPIGTDYSSDILYAKEILLPMSN